MMCSMSTVGYIMLKKRVDPCVRTAISNLSQLLYISMASAIQYNAMLKMHLPYSSYSMHGNAERIHSTEEEGGRRWNQQRSFLQPVWQEAPG